jgi:hypothetical protein
MKYIIKLRMSIEKGNEALKDPDFGHKMQGLLAEIKAEADSGALISSLTSTMPLKYRRFQNHSFYGWMPNLTGSR